VRKSFRFEVEQEPVTQALITNFSSQHNKRIGAEKKSYKARLDTVTEPEAEKTKREEYHLSRALVVFFKTQAHIYFLAGTSHVIHLPFEVEHASPAPNGLIIQRKLQTEKITQVSLKFPKVPPNSFVSSQPQPWSAASSQQSTFSIASLGSPQQLSLPPVGVQPDLWQPPALKDDSNWPRLFSLTDPLAEMGLVVSASKFENNRRSSLKSPTLDSAEEIVHVTTPHDFNGLHSSKDDLLMLAVTLNRETSMYTIWKMNYVNQEDIIESMHHSANTRRRSSFMPGAGTGANTPNLQDFRGSLNGELPKMPKRGDKSAKTGKIDFAAALDPDSDMNTLPQKRSARRVSSMLARGDLSASHERSAFGELTTTGQPKGRGESFGASRASFGHHAFNAHANSNPPAFNVSLNSFLEAPVDDLLQELNAGGDFEGFHNMGLEDEEFDGLRKEIVFTQINKVPAEHSNVRYSSKHKAAHSQCRVFTLAAPSCATADPDYNQLVICIHDPQEKSLLVVTLHAQKSNKAEKALAKGKKKVAIQERDTLIVSWGEIMRAKGVIDACKIIDGETSRILILTESSDGYGEMTLQAPWSLLTHIWLPSKLVINNTTALGHDAYPQMKREGSLKRVLSQGPQSLRGLRNSLPGGLVDILDEQGRAHQVCVQLEPRQPLVKKAINALRLLVPGSKGGEAILIGWWNMRRWFYKERSTEPDIEWTALVVVLFTLVLAFEEKNASPAGKYRRTSSRSLRSSTGAPSDFGNLEEMLAHECSLGSPVPHWMLSSGWAWLNDAQPARPSIKPQIDGLGFIQRHIEMAREFIASPFGEAAIGPMGYLPTARHIKDDERAPFLIDTIIGLHLLHEELKLDITTSDSLSAGDASLSPILAQMCTWTGWKEWVDGYSAEDSTMDTVTYDTCKSPLPITHGRLTNNSATFMDLRCPFPPPSIYEWMGKCIVEKENMTFLTLEDLCRTRFKFDRNGFASYNMLFSLTPRTVMFNRLFSQLNETSSPVDVVEALHAERFTASILETLPEALLVPLQEAIIDCQMRPPTSWGKSLLSLVGREDFNMLLIFEQTKRIAYSALLVRILS
jgi:anaphase-promoting complex subunit 1